MKPIKHLGLLCILGFLHAPAFAERPVALESDMDASTPVDTRQDSSGMHDDARPAATDVTTQTETRGDVLAMPQASEATSAEPELMKKLDFPRRGMKQDKVQEQLGRPIEIVPAVGQPPISRWVYDDRIVYFEYASVIHVVAR